ncbi:hypothetical protein BKA70DRAFT_1236033 [Coprinopsis sp. MPI-PUGE-AT-0042]|nr:hypothetical protein BKA70DRAFT_1236033 [Coprinopsis sp. MPI-PUGE-AT-0042]
MDSEQAYKSVVCQCIRHGDTFASLPTGSRREMILPLRNPVVWIDNGFCLRLKRTNGDYVIVNSVSKTVLETDNGLVIGYPYTMAASQTWTVANEGNFWTIRNSQSKRYLGMRLTDQMKPGNYIVMREVDHGFLWAIELAVNCIK